MNNRIYSALRRQRPQVRILSGAPLSGDDGDATGDATLRVVCDVMLGAALAVTAFVALCTWIGLNLT